MASCDDRLADGKHTGTVALTLSGGERKTLNRVPFDCTWTDVKLLFQATNGIDPNRLRSCKRIHRRTGAGAGDAPGAGAGNSLIGPDWIFGEAGGSPYDPADSAVSVTAEITAGVQYPYGPPLRVATFARHTNRITRIVLTTTFQHSALDSVFGSSGVRVDGVLSLIGAYVGLEETVFPTQCPECAGAGRAECRARTLRFGPHESVEETDVIRAAEAKCCACRGAGTVACWSTGCGADAKSVEADGLSMPDCTRPSLDRISFDPSDSRVFASAPVLYTAGTATAAAAVKHPPAEIVAVSVYYEFPPPSTARHDKRYAVPPTVRLPIVVTTGANTAVAGGTTDSLIATANAADAADAANACVKRVVSWRPTPGVVVVPGRGVHTHRVSIGVAASTDDADADAEGREPLAPAEFIISAPDA